MYIAVESYNNAFSAEDYILILDTSDCTVEAVPVKSLFGFLTELDVKNIIKTYGLSDKIYAKNPDIILSCSLSKSDDFVTYNNGVLRIQGINDITIRQMYNKLRINDIDVVNHKGYSLLYFFLYNDCVVFRCRYRNIRNLGFVTAIVSQDGSVSVYTPSTIKRAKNKAFVMKLEMTNGGI